MSDLETATNRALVLERAAQDGADVPNALKVTPRPIRRPGPGEVLIRAIYVSLDPATITWIRMAAPYNRTGPGDVLPSQVVGVIEESNVEAFAPGDYVSAFAGIEEYTTVGASGAGTDAGEGGTLLVNKIDPSLPLDLYLSLFSHIGTAAISGIKHAAKVQAGQTVLVSGAAGATGSIAAQLAKAYGARVFGIAGGPEKCATLTDVLGLDGAIDHRGDVDAQLSALAPAGVDIFFDTVGGQLLDTVLTHLAVGGQVTVCGASSQYGLAPTDQHRFANIGELILRDAGMTAYWVSDYFAEHYGEYMTELAERLQDGSIKVLPSHIVQGIEAMPQSYAMLLDGRNTGKLIAQFSPAL